MTSRRKPRASARPGSGPSTKLRMSGKQRIIPNKNRKLQIAPTRRRLFGAKAEDEFLEWFAATCNCSLSARKVGFHYRTVLRHWREDAVFGARCEEALRLGYPRLEELALRGAEAALKPKRRRRVKGDRAAPAETLAMTPQDALQLLREHKRGLAGVAKPGRAPTVASNNEVFDALVKRLKAFQVRVREEDAALAVAAEEEGEAEAAAEGSDQSPSSGRSGEEQEETPPPRDARSPSPGKPGEDLEERGA